MQVEEIIARTVGDHYDGYADADHTPNVWKSAITCAGSVIAALDAAGFVIVPKEPTPAMLKASGVALKCFIDALPNEAKLSEKDRFGGYWLHRDMKAAVRYRAMLAARPDASERPK